MAGMGRRGWAAGLKRGVGSAVLGAVLLPVVGCGSFFQCENKPACPTTTGTGTGTGTGSSTLDVAFVAYTTAAGSPVLTGYDISAGALTALNTVTLPGIPVAMAVSAKNTFLYVATVPSATNPGIYAYAISSTGTLTAANSGTVEAGDLVGAMAMSPDGNHLYTLEAAGQAMTQYTVNETTGVLSSNGGVTVQSLGCSPTVTTIVLASCSIAVSPKNDYLWAAQGSYGDAVFTYTSSAGVPSTFFQQPTAGTLSGDFAVAFDGNDNVYLAQTSTLTWLSLTNGQFTGKGTYTYPSGSIPRSTVVDPQSKFVYTADVGTSQITGFAAGSVTTLTGSPYTAPASVSSLGVDSTDTYLVAVGYAATGGVQLYSIASSGVLSALAATAGTSTQTQDPVLVAMTH